MPGTWQSVLNTWYYDLRAVKGRFVWVLVPQKQTLTGELESKGFLKEVGRCSPEGGSALERREGGRVQDRERSASASASFLGALRDNWASRPPGLKGKELGLPYCHSPGKEVNSQTLLLSVQENEVVTETGDSALRKVAVPAFRGKAHRSQVKDAQNLQKKSEVVRAGYPACLLQGQGRVCFTGMWPVQLHRVLPSEGLCLWDSVLYSHHLEILFFF